jgi:protein tyrosine/serine phosphatase
MRNSQQSLPLLLIGCLVAAVAAADGFERQPSAAGAPAQNSAHYGEQKQDLPNFHEVHPYLYRGGEPTKAGLLKLKEMGIATIIDLRGSPEQVYNEEREAKALGMKTVNLPMSSKAPTNKQVKTFLSQVESAAAASSSGPVFVHCAHGSDRTGCMVGIWRVTHEGWNYDKAYQEMRRYYFSPKFTQLSGAVRERVVSQKEVLKEVQESKPASSGSP